MFWDILSVVQNFVWLFFFRKLLEECRFEHNTTPSHVPDPLYLSLVELNFILQYRLRDHSEKAQYYQSLLKHYISILLSIEDIFFDSLHRNHRMFILFSLFINAYRIKCVHHLQDLSIRFKSFKDPLINKLVQLIFGEIFWRNHFLQHNPHHFIILDIGESESNILKEGVQERLSQFVDSLIERLSDSPSPQLTVFLLNALSDWTDVFHCIVSKRI